MSGARRGVPPTRREVRTPWGDEPVRAMGARPRLVWGHAALVRPLAVAPRSSNTFCTWMGPRPVYAAATPCGMWGTA